MKTILPCGMAVLDATGWTVHNEPGHPAQFTVCWSHSEWAL